MLVGQTYLSQLVTSQKAAMKRDVDGLCCVVFVLDNRIGTPFSRMGHPRRIEGPLQRFFPLTFTGALCMRHHFPELAALE